MTYITAIVQGSSPVLSPPTVSVRYESRCQEPPLADLFAPRSFRSLVMKMKHTGRSALQVVDAVLDSAQWRMHA